MNFKNLKLGRTQLIVGILALMILVTGIFMIRIALNELTINSYEANSNPLPARSKLAILEKSWNEYNGSTRDTSATARDAQNARNAVESSYTIITIVDVVLVAALAFVIVKVKH